MKRVAAIVVALAATAHAQPVTHPQVDPCRVTVVVAPPEVRAEIESWVAAEPRCVRELEVSVMPTERGLYLTAKDGTGRVRERVVPDAQSAAVLVVSWMADDSLGPTTAIADEPTPVERPAHVAPPPAVHDDESPFEEHVHHTRFSSHRYLTLGALGSSVEHLGMRVQLDLLGGKHWYLGLAGGWRDDAAQARIIIGAVHSVGPRISVRAQLGLGADVEHRDRDDLREPTMSFEMSPRTGLEPHIEAAVLGRIAIDRNWGVLGGPVVQASDERLSVGAFVGVEHGL